MEKFENSQELINHYSETIESYAKCYSVEIGDDTIYDDLVDEGKLAVLEALLEYESGAGKGFDDCVVENIKKCMYRCIKEINVNHDFIDERKYVSDDDPTYKEVEIRDEIAHIGESIAENGVVGIKAKDSLAELKARRKEIDALEKRNRSVNEISSIGVSRAHQNGSNVVPFKALSQLRESRKQKDDDSKEGKSKL